MYLLNTLAPIVMLIALGTALRRGGFASSGFFRGVNRLVYWVALPSLLFHETAGGAVGLGEGVRLFLVLLGGMLFSMGIGFLCVPVFRVPRGSRGAFVQATFRGNLMYVGLAVIVFSMSAADGSPTPGVGALAVLAIAPLMPLYNIAAVPMLLADRGHDGGERGRRFRRLAFEVATNPIVLSCGAGLAYSLSGRGLPAVVERACGALGRVALPLALLSLGASLNFASLRGRLLHACAASAIKVGCAPLAVYLLRPLLGLSPMELRMALLFLACPAAVNTYVMAEQMGSDDALAGGIVVISTLLSLPAFTAVLVMVQGWG